jgi:hypothetical protein
MKTSTKTKTNIVIGELSASIKPITLHSELCAVQGGLYVPFRGSYASLYRSLGYKYVSYGVGFWG